MDCSCADSSSTEDSADYMFDCTYEKLEQAKRRLAKAFQIWRRQMLEQLRAMQYKKIFKCFEAWQNFNGTIQTKADMIWSREDMDNFLQTVASHTTHKQLWEREQEARRNSGPGARQSRMPRMLPATLIQEFHTIISQTHAEKFWQHFGDGQANADSQFIPACCDDNIRFRWHLVAGSAAPVAESAAQLILATSFQVRLFIEDTTLAFVTRTEHLGRS